MKVLVYPHDLAMGGSQLNAIDIARTLRDQGQEVIVYGQSGPLVARIRAAGLEFIEAPSPSRRPSRRVVKDLSRLVKERQIDVLHGYEWPPGLECYLAARASGAVAVTTVMSMAVASFLPYDMPLIVGTEQIAAAERRAGRMYVSVIEPPVDTVANHPSNAGDVEGFRRRWLPDQRPTLVCVTRLVPQLKLEGLLTAIEAVVRVNESRPLRLVIVGNGPSRKVIEEQAGRANARAGPGTVILTGELEDPRPAYAAATISLGMGGSALRSLAYGTPLIVQGGRGYFRLLTEETVHEFLWSGWYGEGGPDDPAAGLAAELISLLDQSERRTSLGDFGQQLVVQRFSLKSAGAHQEEILLAALARRPPSTWRQRLSRTASMTRFAGYHLVKRAKRLRGIRITDDFNGRPVSGLLPPARSLRPAWLWFAGVQWDGVAGTDRQLVTELAAGRPVVWVDPPMSGLARRRRGISVPPVSGVDDSIIRVNTTTPPGVSRPLLRELARVLTVRHARRVARESGLAFEAVVVSTPEQSLPRRSAGWLRDATRLYYETDDFVAGADLLGHSREQLMQRRLKNVVRSDVVLGVTDHIVDELLRMAPLDGPSPRGVVLANGCHPDRFVAEDASALIRLPRPIAGLIGQLNDRLDLDMLECLAASGSSLLLVGPRYEQLRSTRVRLDALVALPNVQWIDRQPFERIPHLLAGLEVGLTPYTDTLFNRASFPLKTLEYLAAGLPVVSTDLPSARSLASPDVTCVTTPIEFAAAVGVALTQTSSKADIARRRGFAAHHSWTRRASTLVEARRSAARCPQKAHTDEPENLEWSPR